MGNDLGNAEFMHFNQLAVKFVIHFNEDNKIKVACSQFDRGKIMIAEKNIVFKTHRQIYIKELSSPGLKAPSRQ